jgi:hypothetical protein
MVVVALRGPRIRAPPNVIATLIRRHFNGLRGPPVVGTPNATHEGIKPTVDNLPDSIVKLSELDIAGLITKFGKGEERLMKFGARTGHSEFWIGYDEALMDGRECAAIIPLRGARNFNGDTIVEGGDSSSPVVDKDGVMHGMVSAKHLQAEVGYMVLTSQIMKAAEEMGYKLELA